MRHGFANTGYWVALIDDDDDLHIKSVSLSRALGPVLFVTHELVLVELLNHFSAYGPTYRRKALENVERTRQMFSLEREIECLEAHYQDLLRSC